MTMEVDFDNNRLKVMGKRNKERIIPIIPSLKKQLLHFSHFGGTLARQSQGIQAFVCNQKERKISDTLVYQLVNDYLSKVSNKG